MRVWAFFLTLLSFLPLALDAQVSKKTMEDAFLSLKDNPAKVDSLNKLSRGLEEPEQTISYGLKVMALAEKINYKKGIAQSLNNIGVAWYDLENGQKALEHHIRALRIREELGDKKSISASFSNLGNTYDQLGDKKLAIDYHTRALRIKEELKDTLGMAISNNNIASAYIDLPDYYKAIECGFKAVNYYKAAGENSSKLADALNTVGNAYEKLKDFDKSLDHYEKALAIHKELGDQGEIAKKLNNIANIYLLQGQGTKDNELKKLKFKSALDNYSRSLSILEVIDDVSTIAVVYNNIANVHWELSSFPEALVYLNKSLALYQEMKSPHGVAFAMNSLSKHFLFEKKYDRSIQYALRALALADSINDSEQKLTATEMLSTNYYELKQFEKSLLYFKRYVEEKEKLTNVEGAKKLAQEESRMEFEKREQKLKLEQEKQNAIAEAESQRQKLISWSAGIGLMLVVVFSIFIYNRFRHTQKQNKIIEEQKSEVDHKNKALQGANAEIAQKNKDITDSIQYAKRIQRALLASDTLLKKNLPEYFVLYKPKDIVSGDFYWANHVNGKFLLIAADCTGHGVPGAFMSLLNISLLNEITLQRKLTQPDLILNSVREQILTTLNPEGVETESKDGMDCMLCSFDFKNGKMEFAAANNPLWILKGGSLEIEEYKPDKQPVGFHSIYKPFTLQTSALEKGDTVYAFTDGFADQFGGPKGKKFKYKQLEELILANGKRPMIEQKNALENSFEAWKGDLEQVDDVLVIGIRI